MKTSGESSGGPPPGDGAGIVKTIGRLFMTGSMLAAIVAAFQMATAFMTFGSLQVDTTARAVPIVVMILALATLAVSRALLRRRRWARMALMTLLALGIAASAVLLVVRAASPAELPGDGPASYQRILRLIRLVDVAAPLAGGVACGWIFLRLRSAEVRDVFGG